MVSIMGKELDDYRPPIYANMTDDQQPELPQYDGNDDGDEGESGMKVENNPGRSYPHLYTTLDGNWIIMMII